MSDTEVDTVELINSRRAGFSKLLGLVVTEATRVQVLTLDGVPRHVLDLPGAINLAGLGADERHIFVCDASRGCVYSLQISWPDEGDRFAGELNE